MNEQNGSVGSIGAMASLDDYASSSDDSPPQTKQPTMATATVSGNASRPSEQAVQSAVDRINAYLSGVDRVLSLKVDPGSGYVVAQISDAQTGEVLQQMPTEDHIQLERMLARWSHGGNVLMDVEV